MTAEYERAQDDAEFRDYVADSINLLAQRKHFVKQFSKRHEVEDTRSGDEIAKDIIERHGLKVVA